MIQNYNNKEYEILDTGGMGYQSRYPLAKEPGSELQQMNYKDWMNRCANGKSGDLFADLNTAMKNGVITGTAILSYVLSVSFPQASAAVGIVSLLLPILWPEEPESPQSQFTWNQLITAVEELINSAMTAEAKRDAIDALQRLQVSVDRYQRAVCNLKANPDSDVYKANVRSAFVEVDGEARRAIVTMDDNPPTHAVQFLASYAEAANVHLLILRDVVQHGESWGFSPLEVQQFYDYPSGGLGTLGMKQLLAHYTDYCVRWYNIGLQQQYDTGNWGEFNLFRRSMTIMAMDIVFLWPTYDPRLYSLPTKSQLTRTVYQGQIGYSDDRRLHNIYQIETHGTVPPRLFAWLQGIDAYVGEVATEHSATIPEKINSFIQTFENTLDGRLWETFTGAAVGKIQIITLPTSQSQDDIWRIKSGTLYAGHPFWGYALNEMQFSLTKSKDQRIETQFPSERHELNGLPCNPCDSNNSCEHGILGTSNPCNDKLLYSHRFSNVAIGAPSYDAIYAGAIYGWTHISTDANNLIDTEKITQIPAVKGYQLFGNAKVVLGPGSTGGDLVQLGPEGVLFIRVTGQVQKGYQLRIRYASTGTNRLFVDRYLDDSSEADYTVPVNLPPTYSGES